jgi:hypothetical protein
VDNREQKRLGQFTRLLGMTLITILGILLNLDEIRLARRTGEGLREEYAGDLMMVANDVLPQVKAPGTILVVTRMVLTEWVILHDLLVLAQETGATPRRLDTIDEAAERLGALMGGLQDMAPGLFEDRPDLFGDQQ